jgi:DNA-binding NtrC family response regulator
VTQGDDLRPTILVIDDEAMIRATVGRILERAGYRVRTAETGDDALALVRREHFDAVLCDLHIAGTDVAILCEKIWLAAPDLAGRLIVTSGDLTGKAADELVQRSGVPPVSKPFTGADLLRAVGAICPGSPPQLAVEGHRAAS